MTDKPENFDELESALRNLPLRPPSAGLDVRVRRDLEPHRAPRWYFGVGASLAAAAAILIAMWLNHPIATRLVASTQRAPTAAQQTANATELWTDEGIVGYSSDGPVRQYRIVGQLAAANGGKTKTIEEVIEVVSEAY